MGRDRCGYRGAGGHPGGAGDDAAGDQSAARAAWQQALAILDHLGPIRMLGPGPGFPDAGQIRASYAEGSPSRGPLMHICEQTAMQIASSLLETPAMPTLEIL